MAILADAFHLSRAVLRGAVRRFLDARGFDLAASLAYASLLTIVPLMAAVTFLTSTVFGTTGAGLYRVIRWVVPGAGRDVLDAIQAFAHKARRSPDGFAPPPPRLPPDLLPDRERRQEPLGDDRPPAAVPRPSRHGDFGHGSRSGGVGS